MPIVLIHVADGCITYLNEGRCTWHHDSALKALEAAPNLFVYADITGFLSPSLITGDRLCPDLILVTSNKQLFLLKRTV